MRTAHRYNTVQLDPQRHSDGVRLFMEFFDVRPKRPDLAFLQEIIERFAAIPYENISKIIKLNSLWEAETKIRLPGEIIDEHISFRLGGPAFR